MLLPFSSLLRDLCVLWSLLRSFSRGRVLCSNSAVLGCGTIEPSEFCHGFSNRYLCLLYLFPEYVQESGQESLWGSVVDDVYLRGFRPRMSKCYHCYYYYYYYYEY